MRRTLLTLVVGGALAVAAACSSTPSAPPRPADPVLAQGQDVYNARCAACHGINGEGVRGPGMSGIAERISLDRHLDAVINGRMPGMPPWGTTLTEAEIEAVVRYEREILSPLPPS